MKRVLLLILVVCPFWSWGQMGRDSILTNERSMDRPITLHGGQLRVSGNYLLGFNSSRYDGSGNSIDLTTDGFANVSNALSFELKYGISNSFQFTAAMGNWSQAIRSRTTTVLLLDEPSLDIHTLNVYEGWKDIFVALDFRAPLRSRKVDLLVSAGVYLPTASHGQKLPSHSMATLGSFNVISYQYNHQMGAGTTVLQAGSLVKYRFTNIAISAAATYLKPNQEVSMMAYEHQLNGNAFEYREAPYALMLGDELRVFGEVEYQLFPWFDLLAAFNYQYFTGGYSYESGNKVNEVDASLSSLSPGFEIIVTSRVWLRQRVTFPISGRNQISPLTFSTTLNYNVFPFH